MGGYFLTQANRQPPEGVAHGVYVFAREGLDNMSLQDGEGGG